MAVTADSLVQRVRRFVRDIPDWDATTASISSGGTTLTVADTSVMYNKNRQYLEIDQECLQVTAILSGTTMTVRRGARGTTATSHASGATILVMPRFYYQDVLDGLNSALDASYPWMYQRVVDTSLSFAASTYEYSIPTMSELGGIAIPYIDSIELLQPGDIIYRPVEQFHIIRGDGPIIQFLYEQPVNSTIRIKGIGPLAHLSLPADTIDPQVPYNATDAFVFYAGSYLMESAEAERSRTDTGMIDSREQANRPGVSAAVSLNLLQRFQMRLSACGMPPPGKHYRPTF